MGTHDPADKMKPEVLDKLINGWCDLARPLSKHLALAVSAAMHRKRRKLSPLRDGEPIPGCDCPQCTGVAKDASVRMVATKSRYRPTAYNRPLNLDAARAVSILEVARRLGWEVNVRRPYVLCPFHSDSKPSLHLNPVKNRAFCNPCGRSWDVISLYGQVRGVPFPQAVRELAA